MHSPTPHSLPPGRELAVTSNPVTLACQRVKGILATSRNPSRDTIAFLALSELHRLAPGLSDADSQRMQAEVLDLLAPAAK